MSEIKLTTAYNDKFLKSLKKIRQDIEEELVLFLKFITSSESFDKRIFDNVESRIKSKSSFTEKIKRKNYIETWDVKSTIKENQKLIRENLPDLIGFRINCFFKDDEEYFYNKLKEYFINKNFSSDILLDFDENICQKNGHLLYKVTGIYKSQYRFEIQIKSLMHNFWGEIEHRTIFKNCNFDTHISSKKVFTEEIFNILVASDKQLLSLFNETQSEDQLIQALFFNYTKSRIIEIIDTKVLANHYVKFFSLFNDDSIYSLIKTFVGNNITGIEYERLKINRSLYSNTENRLRNIIKETFQSYNLNIFYFLMSFLIKFENQTQFELFLSKFILDRFPIEYEEPLYEDVFDTTELEVDDDQFKMILNYLKTFLELKEDCKNG